jgi:hypothetical protein
MTSIVTVSLAGALAAVVKVMALPAGAVSGVYSHADAPKARTAAAAVKDISE